MIGHRLFGAPDQGWRSKRRCAKFLLPEPKNREFAFVCITASLITFVYIPVYPS